MPSRRFTDEQESEIGERYLSGESMVTLASAYATNHRTIGGALRRAGVASRKVHRKHDLNEDAFANAPLSEEASYFAGLLFADGSVHKKTSGQPEISLALSGADGVLVKRFRDFVGSTHTLLVRNQSRGYPNGKPFTKVSFVSQKMADDLARYGVTPRKSKTAKVLGGMRVSRHWWRGCIDGDGWLGFKGTGMPYLGFTGSKASVRQFRDYFEAIIPNRVKLQRNGSIWAVVVAGKGAAVLARQLYADSKVALLRKNRIAIRMMHYLALRHDDWKTDGSEGDFGRRKQGKTE